MAKKTDIAILEGELDRLIGTGWTTEIMKGNADDLSAHIDE